MPVHPAAPDDVPGFADAYRRTVTSFADVAETLREADWESPTSCPGWPARAHLAHVLHLEDVLTGTEHPGGHGLPEGPPPAKGSPEHVRNSFAAYMEEGVLARADRSPREMLDELRGVMEVRSAQLYDQDLTLDTLVPGIRGREAPLGPMLLLRLGDIWVHEQDLRELVGRPGSLDTVGASAFVTLIEDAFTDVVVEKVAPPPGTTVILESTGPLAARMGVRVGEADDGSLVGHPLFSGHAEEGGPAHQSAASGPTTTISMSTDALTRRAAGRRPAADTPYHVVGDEDLAARVVEALVITP